MGGDKEHCLTGETGDNPEMERAELRGSECVAALVRGAPSRSDLKEGRVDGEAHGGRSLRLAEDKASGGAAIFRRERSKETFGGSQFTYFMAAIYLFISKIILKKKFT